MKISMKKTIVYTLAAFSFLFVTGCGPKVFKKGEYDEDIERTNLLNDKWSESDMQKVVKDLVGSLTNHYTIAGATKAPVVMVTKLQNKTSEHIDTQSVMDMVRVELMNSGKVMFVDKEAREDIKEEYDYQASGVVSKDTQKKGGSQVGADYILNGRLDSIVQEVGKDKTVYYKVTLNLTSLEKNLVVWSGHKQLRKIYKKKSVGL